VKEFALMLDGTHFTFCKLDEDGERTGKIQEWRVRPGNSMLPSAIFYHIQKKLRSATTRTPGSRDAIAEALVVAARECDCVAEGLLSPPGVLWLKDTKKFIWFLLSDNWSTTPRPPALLRFRVDLQGFIHPQSSGVE
jgi:hypothetical protein